MIIRDPAPLSSYELKLIDEDPEVPQMVQTPAEVIDLSSDCELMEGENEEDILEYNQLIKSR